MKIYKRYNKVLFEQESLIEAIGIKADERNHIAVVGGGGKTTTIEHLAAEFLKQREQVIITPTTKIKRPADSKVITTKDIEVIREQKGILIVGQPFKDEKLAAVSDDLLEKILCHCPVVLMEADGSKGLPAKAPAQWEPVIPENITMLIAVMGLDALNQKIVDVSHRPELVCDVLNKAMDHVLTEEDLASLLLDESGQAKFKDRAEEFRIILHKADNQERLEQAVRIAQHLEERGFEGTVITSKLWNEI